MRRIATLLISIIAPFNFSAAEPYTFTPTDYLEYGIYFSPRAAGPMKRVTKLMTIRTGDIKTWYARYNPQLKDIPGLTQNLRLSTPRGSVEVNRQDDIGLTVSRDIYKVRGYKQTKRLDVRFQNATCTDTNGVKSSCVVDLVLTMDKPELIGTNSSRTLRITTSTGLSFTYRSAERALRERFDRRVLARSAVIANYAWDWRRGDEE
jgi:hypothetical protein